MSAAYKLTMVLLLTLPQWRVVWPFGFCCEGRIGVISSGVAILPRMKEEVEEKHQVSTGTNLVANSWVLFFFYYYSLSFLFLMHE